MAGNKKWIITASGDVKMTDLKKQLATKGFNIEQQMDEIHCFTGTADEATVQHLKSIPGVLDISPDTNIDIGPPDAPVTW